MKRSDARHRLAFERTETTMELQAKGGRVRRRKMVTINVQDDKRGDRMRIRFTSPTKVAGTGLLSVEGRRGGDDNQWLYLPAFQRTRRVGTAELGDRFVGTDLYYEDLKRRRVEDFRYRLVGSESLDGHDCWLIESRPAAAKVVKESPYGKSLIWLRKDVLFVVRVRAFDRQMRALKQIDMSKLERIVKKTWRARRVTVVDVQRRHRTVLTVSARNVNKRVEDSTFSRHTLAQSI